ncbi:hypothetical protein JCM10908_007021 [Rhodotorula pacifica]|uniref:glycosyltransferase family 2 protein n=1 Tax=Rhodotorula pacifica TaxID=1495444 RepID=UPI003175E548
MSNTRFLGRAGILVLVALVVLYVPYRYSNGGAATSFVAPASGAAAAAETESVLQALLTVPEDEVGGLAICAAVRNEGRFIAEWLLYYRVLGVDRFYLYDSGSTDNMLEVLQPWVKAGTVVLHTFSHDQGSKYQTTALETCSRTYGPTTEWLLEADADEFYVVTPDLTSQNRSRAIALADMPKQPLRHLLLHHWIYRRADAIVSSRIAWKNAAYEQLPEGASVIATQTWRDFHHSIIYDKITFTKSLLHTQKKELPWLLTGAHNFKHESIKANEAKIMTADGQPVKADYRLPDEEVGTAYHGQHQAVRVFEPLVLYHYVERALQDCLRKLRVAQTLRKGGWRDQAGPEGCKRDELYYDPSNELMLHEQNTFYAASTQDRTIADSWYGQHLPALIVASLAHARDLSKTGEVVQPQVVEPHSVIVDFWREKGLSPLNGTPL